MDGYFCCSASRKPLRLAPGPEVLSTSSPQPSSSGTKGISDGEVYDMATRLVKYYTDGNERLKSGKVAEATVEQIFGVHSGATTFAQSAAREYLKDL